MAEEEVPLIACAALHSITLTPSLRIPTARIPKGSTGAVVLGDHITNMRELSPMSVVSSASLEALNRLSPASDTPSLEKFLSTPASQDHVSATILEATILDTPPARRFFKTYSSASPAPGRTYSVARSASSASSAHSFQSWQSTRSVDSRGSRRGRKGWTQFNPRSHAEEATYHSYKRLASPPTPAPSVRCHDQTGFPFISASGEGSARGDLGHTVAQNDVRQFFCTWPSCSSRFQYRYDWIRHEEALHYCPFHWICCSANARSSQCLICTETNHTTTQHCGSCLTKDVQLRTFLREDQLAQHIKRAHFPNDATKPRISKELLSAWKINNPDFPRSCLRCGFCGVVSGTWAQRQDHVHGHLRKGICKSS
jgi:hypothetical protein